MLHYFLFLLHLLGFNKEPQLTKPTLLCEEPLHSIACKGKGQYKRDKVYQKFGYSPNQFAGMWGVPGLTKKSNWYCFDKNEENFGLGPEAPGKGFLPYTRVRMGPSPPFFWEGGGGAP